ncbi:MAG: hypothetical protein R3F54_30660 [Alphaproteobacteria bacterium]
MARGFSEFGNSLRAETERTFAEIMDEAEKAELIDLPIVQPIDPARPSQPFSQSRHLQESLKDGRNIDAMVDQRMPGRPLIADLAPKIVDAWQSIHFYTQSAECKISGCSYAIRSKLVHDQGHLVASPDIWSNEKRDIRANAYSSAALLVHLGGHHCYLPLLRLWASVKMIGIAAGA